MPKPLPRIALVAAAFAFVSAASWLVGAGAPAPAVAPAAQQSATIAVVDFKRVYDNLQEVKDRNRRMTDLEARFNEELSRITGQLDAINADIEARRQEDPAITDLLQRKMELDIQRRNLVEIYSRRLGFENAVIARDVYNKFSKTVESLAQRDGLDLVLLDDRPIGLPAAAAGIEMLTDVIGQKKIIHAGQRVNITDQVIAMMDNEYAAAARQR